MVGIQSYKLLNDIQSDEKTPIMFDHKLDTYNNIHVTDTLVFGDDFKESIKFNNSKFQAVEFATAIFAEDVFFKNCVFEEDVEIDGASFSWALFFINCEFKGNFIIRNLYCNTFLFENNICNNPVNIKGGHFERMVYSSVNEKTIFKVHGRFTFIESLKLTSFTGMTFFSKNCIVNDLLIEGYFNTPSRIDLMGMKVFHIEMDNVNNDGKIYFSNFHRCKVKELNYIPLSEIGGMSMFDEKHRFLQDQIKRYKDLEDHIELYNYSYFSSNLKEVLYSLTASQTFVFDLTPNIKPIFKVNYCSLGILELKDIDLENMDVQIMSSDLSSIKLINSTFPLKIEAYNKLNEYYVFNDIYTSANKQNNYQDKIDYYRVSQEALGQYLRFEWFNNLPSLISIWISKKYSNHGSNWIQAIILTIFGIALPLFCLFTLSFTDISFDFSLSGLKYFINEILPYFPQFLNPIHKIEFMENISKRMGFWSGWIDIFARVLIGIGLFETVRSFRKFVRT